MTWNHIKFGVGVFLTVAVITVLSPRAVQAGGNEPGVHEIYEMQRDGLSTDVLVDHLDVSGFQGRLTREEAAFLTKKGVSRRVIRKIREIDDSSSNDPDSSAEEPGGERISGETTRNRRRTGSNARSSGKSTMVLRSTASDPVWFRRDPGERTLHLSGSGKETMPSLTGGDSIRVSAAAGTWKITSTKPRSTYRVRLKPGQTGILTVLNRDKRKITVNWTARNPSERKRKIVLQRGGLDMKEVKRVIDSLRSARKRSGSRSRRNRSGRRPGNWNRRGRAYTGLNFSFPPLGFHYIRKYPQLYYAPRRFHGNSPPPHRHYRRKSSRGFDFRLYLNHDFRAGGKHGSFRFHLGRSGFQHRSFQVD